MTAFPVYSQLPSVFVGCRVGPEPENLRFRSESCHRKETKWIECVSEQDFGKAFGTKREGVSVRKKALQFVLFVKCY